MADLIESSIVLKKCLGDHLARIRKLDPLPARRKETSAFRIKLLGKFGSICGYCSKSGRVDAAHIVPLEIGGLTTEENLILLCQHCHKHYDQGHLSITAMRKVADSWRQNVRGRILRAPLALLSAGSPTIIPAPQSVGLIADEISRMQRLRKYRKATRLITQQLTATRIDRAGRVYLLITYAELSRRRSARGSAEVAMDCLKGIEVADIPQKYLSRFFYELGYIHRILGRHVEAGEYFRQSAAAIEDIESSSGSVEYVAAVANELLCEISAEDRLERAKAESLEKRFDKLRLAVAAQGGAWGSGWAINIQSNILRIRIKALDRAGSWDKLDEIRDAHYGSDIDKGWSAAARPGMPEAEGLVRVLFPNGDSDIDVGIGLLARAFLARLGHRQRQEGVRDTGIALATGLSVRPAAS